MSGCTVYCLRNQADAELTDLEIVSVNKCEEEIGRRNFEER